MQVQAVWRMIEAEPLNPVVAATTSLTVEGDVSENASRQSKQINVIFLVKVRSDNSPGNEVFWLEAKALLWFLFVFFSAISQFFTSIVPHFVSFLCAVIVFLFLIIFIL